MFPISSLTSPDVQPVSRASKTSAVGNTGINAVDTATDAPPAASVAVDLSPVASFLLAVNNAQEQLGQAPGSSAQRADTVNAAVQKVVDGFNLLPSVDFDQGAAQQASLLNNLVNSLNQQPNDGASSQAQQLSQLGVTLQPPLLSDLAGGLSLEPEQLRAAVNANNEQATSTLQNTLATFRQLATDFAEQLSAAGSSQIPGLNPDELPALTQQDLAANARLDLARATLDSLSQSPQPETIADRLAAQQATATGQENAAQAAAARNAANAPVDPLRANPALAAAVAAYNINGVAGVNAGPAQAAANVIPAVDAVNAATAVRPAGTQP